MEDPKQIVEQLGEVEDVENVEEVKPVVEPMQLTLRFGQSTIQFTIPSNKSFYPNFQELDGKRTLVGVQVY